MMTQDDCHSGEGPLVCIGMPVYNGGCFLETSLHSIEQQTYTNWMLIVSDDCSNDESLHYLERHARKDTRIRIYEQSRTLGPLQNFSYVLEQCYAKYFMWHCQDDWTDANYLEFLIDILERSERCALACGASNRVDIDGRLLKRKPFPDLPGCDEFARVQRLLYNSDATRIFGVFRTEQLRPAFQTALAFGYVWGWDPLALLPFILSDKIRGTNETTFYWRDTGLSYNTYRPKGVIQQIIFNMNWYASHFRLLDASQRTRHEKLRCIHSLLSHAHERSGVSFYRTHVRSTYRKYLKKPLIGLIRRWGRWQAMGALAMVAMVFGCVFFLL